MNLWTVGCADPCDGPGSLDSFRGGIAKGRRRLLVSPFPEIQFILSCCGVLLVRRSRFPLRKATCGGSNGGGLLTYFRQLVVGKIGESAQTQWHEHGSSGCGEAPSG